MNPLSDLKHVHIIGVCGTLMGSFAAFLKRAGIRVTGSDQNVYPPMSDVLKNAGVELYSGYKAENLQQMSSKPDLVVIGNVISATNPEAKFAIESGYAYSSLPEFMQKWMLPQTRNLVVAGTHGKTTTSSLLAHVLNSAGAKPSYFIGGVSQDLPFSFNVTDLSSKNYFVLEGDEYDTAFWAKVPKFNFYLPDDVILTSVEYDHADIYPDLAAVVRAFEGLVTRVRPGGRMIACIDYPEIPKLLKQAKVPVITYSTKASSGADFNPANIKTEKGVTSFDVMEKGKKITSIQINLSGEYNVMNALAVWIETRALGIDAEKILKGLKTFQGVKRRQEERGEINGVLVLDDFAHHPTAVRETLKGLKAKYPDRRVVAIFEPRSATSRRKVFQKDYTEAFDTAAVVFIPKPYDQSKINAAEQFSSEQLVADLVARGRNAYVMSPVDHGGVTQVAEICKQGDLVAVLSNGGFDGFIPKLLSALSK